MNRLTQPVTEKTLKNLREMGMPDFKYQEKDDVLICDCIDKLGELEDIEQELGIDLITLFKAVKNGIYYTKDAFVSAPDCLKENVIYRAENQNVHYELGGSQKKCSVGISVYVRERNCYYYLKTADYGKTWALTKEELDNE